MYTVEDISEGYRELIDMGVYSEEEILFEMNNPKPIVESKPKLTADEKRIENWKKYNARYEKWYKRYLKRMG